ncbi:hypothetical protein BO82DRAFT_39586 [Aspergillus uvarum CBS 121591]|uniref:Uncharacterized protein n=1 Tax=Aspergillus uvarum CBS 121591 TaxID=1448315 RepID=A0A319CKT0_9EURO|nr:hypothetical protein BO82DRAFT_39586 [Aspergillus uvarum CBS 121591]PYH83727.1 hypothetical protein BO82DRAFT_39586 [Aspergillus uvarum CBS 121591]
MGGRRKDAKEEEQEVGRRRGDAIRRMDPLGRENAQLGRNVTTGPGSTAYQQVELILSSESPNITALNSLFTSLPRGKRTGTIPTRSHDDLQDNGDSGLYISLHSLLYIPYPH